VFKITESGKLRKFFLVLVNKDTYYYKSEKKTDFVGMHNLSGCFVQECNEKKEIEGAEYYSFEIFCKNKSKTRKYYTNSEDICKEFVEKIKKAIGYVKFSDLYEMKEVIGKGKFGVVNLGIHKKTGQQVAIKILNKENIKTAEDKELVRIEIGILKLCHHPNIVRLLDHLENNDYIYIITEYIEGGTLGQYFKKKKFNFSERQATNIMMQIANGVKYLQQYGIVHRDLKPDNIMITQQNDYGVIKIMDFGLSKIVSPNERMVDGYGTLSYVAPEVLLRTPYNKEVDIWSLGVILFYMLSGKLPFRGRKEQEVAEKIVYDPLEFDEDDWETRSQRVQDLISCCLEKKKENRITIDEFINHPWFKKNMKQKYSM
jgi:serine/threonine protein kinase